MLHGKATSDEVSTKAKQLLSYVRKKYPDGLSALQDFAEAVNRRQGRAPAADGPDGPDGPTGRTA